MKLWSDPLIFELPDLVIHPSQEQLQLMYLIQRKPTLYADVCIGAFSLWLFCSRLICSALMDKCVSKYFLNATQTWRADCRAVNVISSVRYGVSSASVRRISRVLICKIHVVQNLCNQYSRSMSMGRSFLPPAFAEEVIFSVLFVCLSVCPCVCLCAL